MINWLAIYLVARLNSSSNLHFQISAKDLQMDLLGERWFVANSELANLDEKFGARNSKKLFVAFVWKWHCCSQRPRLFHLDSKPYNLTSYHSIPFDSISFHTIPLISTHLIHFTTLFETCFLLLLRLLRLRLEKPLLLTVVSFTEFSNYGLSNLISFSANERFHSN